MTLQLKSASGCQIISLSLFLLKPVDFKTRNDFSWVDFYHKGWLEALWREYICASIPVRGIGMMFKRLDGRLVKSNRAGTALRATVCEGLKKYSRAAHSLSPDWGDVQGHLLGFNWERAHCSELRSYCHLVPLSGMAPGALSSKNNGKVGVPPAQQTRFISGHGGKVGDAAVSGTQTGLRPSISSGLQPESPLIGTKLCF